MDAAVDEAKAHKKHNGLFVLACARGYLADAERLVEMGADVTACDKRRVSGLHYACGQGRLEVVRFLWSRGVELDAEDPGGRTPVHWAVLGARPDVLAFLLEKRAWAEGADGADDTPLHLAARSEDMEMLGALVAAVGRAGGRARNKRGLTPLGEAVAAGHAAAAELLATQGGGDVRDRPRGWSLAHLAAALAHPAALAVLLRHSAPAADADNAEALTPLHCAALASSAECVQMLLDAGADRAAAAADGRVPRDCALVSNSGLRERLATSAAPRPAARASGKAPAAPASPAEAFKALGEAEQARRVDRWATLDDPGARARVADGLPREILRRIEDLRTTHQILAIQRAINELHEDEDFQRDATLPHVRAAVDDTRGHGERLERYASDAVVMDVMAKLRRFQMVIAANGHHQVPFEDLLVGGTPGWQAKDEQRVRGMKIMAARQTRAAVAAATADSEEAAKSAADAEIDPPPPPQSQSAPEREVLPEEPPQPFTWQGFARYRQPACTSGCCYRCGLSSQHSGLNFYGRGAVKGTTPTPGPARAASRLPCKQDRGDERQPNAGACQGTTPTPGPARAVRPPAACT
ncbi:hypothetical protein WJX81_007989 [Elliptochloris bilobata]|uniref:Uncharacterized protein n=1 Tax=Elliptochloris bilobata TaxID=381761 RepID=A0AAW1S7S6_9CHLO